MRASTWQLIVQFIGWATVQRQQVRLVERV
jgi:hypothetical protein